MQSDGSHRARPARRRRPHAAARARIVAGVMSVVTFVGVGSAIAIRATPGTSTAAAGASGTDATTRAGGSPGPSASIGSALPGTGASLTPITTSHGS